VPAFNDTRKIPIMGRAVLFIGARKKTASTTRRKDETVTVHHRQCVATAVAAAKADGISSAYERAHSGKWNLKYRCGIT